MSKMAFIYSLENETYKQIGAYNFWEEKINSSRFENLKIDIKNIELIEDEDDI